MSADWIDTRSSCTSSATALAVMLYALYTFHWRAAAIRKRSTAPYDDRVGPVRRFRPPNDPELMKPTHPPLDCLVHCTTRYVLLNVDSRTLGLRICSGCHRQLCPPIHSRLKESGHAILTSLQKETECNLVSSRCNTTFRLFYSTVNLHGCQSSRGASSSSEFSMIYLLRVGSSHQVSFLEVKPRVALFLSLLTLTIFSTSESVMRTRSVDKERRVLPEKVRSS